MCARVRRTGVGRITFSTGWSKRCVEMWGRRKHTTLHNISLSPINAFTLLTCAGVNRWSSPMIMDIEETLGDPSRLGLTSHHKGSVPRKGPSLSLWRAPQSRYGSVLAALEMPLSNSRTCRGLSGTHCSVCLKSVSFDFHVIPLNKSWSCIYS